jgi:hypothetical protein
MKKKKTIKKRTDTKAKEEAMRKIDNWMQKEVMASLGLQPDGKTPITKKEENETK